MAPTTKPAFPYVVRPGDHLLKVANRHGCAPDEIWNHPKNERLRGERGDGSILCPGDLLWVPSSPRRSYDVRPGVTNEYTLVLPTTRVSFLLRSERGLMTNEPYRVLELPGGEARRSDGEGKVVFEVPIHFSSVTVELPERGVTLIVKVGDLDPAGTKSGVVQRLINLGYLAPDLADDPDGLAEAVRHFQQVNDLANTGQLDEATRTALAKAHGA